jgi:hypothetical protein
MLSGWLAVGLSDSGTWGLVGRAVGSRSAKVTYCGLVGRAVGSLSAKVTY